MLMSAAPVLPKMVNQPLMKPTYSLPQTLNAKVETGADAHTSLYGTNMRRLSRDATHYPANGHLPHAKSSR